ncbi:MAG TPA: T9SS type A sorting domain-containing protein [Bacteroidales bacterium]|nr:T9SS type A sorting domain-containing protein [Bacteroidales bacterium]HSA44828.1 T9SS type A sorting domain-containing protein [Bacteroidales bacterium]
MKKKSLFFIIIFALPNILSAQAILQWQCFPKYDDGIHSMLDLDTAILVGSSSGGISCINKTNLQVSYFNQCNSGLVGNGILALEKCQDGSIWIGTNCGLVKWQGNNWTVFTPQNSILHSGVSAIRYCEPLNALFLGLVSGGVIKIDSSGWSFVFGLNGTMPAARVHDVEIDLNGNIWAACQFGTGIYMFDGLNWQHYNQSNSLVNSRVFDVAVDSAGIVWLALIIKFLSFNGTSWTNHPGCPTNMHHISIEENNTKWVSGYQGLYVFNGITFSYHPVNSVLTDIRLRYHLKGKDQKLWTGMRYYGVDYADGMNVTHFPLTPEFDASVFKDIAYDKVQAKVWFATGGADKPTFLLSFDGTVWEHFNNTNTPIAQITTSAVAVDSNSTVYLGTIYDGIWMKQGNTWTNFTSSNSNLFPGSISSLAMDSLNRLLVGNAKGQIQYFVNGNFYTLLNNPLVSSVINHIVPVNASAFWASTDSSGLIYCNYSGFNVFNTTNSGIPSNTVKDLTVDHLNRCWIATNAGLGLYDGQNWTTFNSSNSGLFYNNLISITVAPDSTVWMGYASSSYEGVSIFDGSTWTNLQCNVPLIGNHRMKTFPNGKICLASDGLNIISFDYLTTNQPVISKPTMTNPFPNPGSGTIQFSFLSPAVTSCKFSIYNTCGQQVFSRPVLSGIGGEVTVMWDTDENPVPAGIYFYTLIGENIRQSGKVVVQK